MPHALATQHWEKQNPSPAKLCLEDAVAAILAALDLGQFFSDHELNQILKKTPASMRASTHRF